MYANENSPTYMLHCSLCSTVLHHPSETENESGIYFGGGKILLMVNFVHIYGLF